ncbi:MAG: ABC transporter substrate-binding protein [Verrucomicrobiae bacterium]
MKLSFALLSVLSAFIFAGCGESGKPSIKIGLNAELTGEMPAVGASSKNAADLFVGQINAAGGIDVGGKKLPIELEVGDNGAKSDQSRTVAQRLISQGNVVIMVGPNASSCAIPAAIVAETSKCPMITPWSTNPKTTVDDGGKPKKYVFRACFVDTFEAQVLAKFVLNTLQAKTAAVLYDVASEAPTAQSKLFKDVFEQNGGKVVAFETYTTGDRDFSAQLTKIKATNPEVFFLPTYYNDAAGVARQARQQGMTSRFVGSDAWSSPEIIKLGGDSVEGAYFCNHYSTEIATPAARKFMEDYTAKFGRAPDDVAALTYDAFGLACEAIRAAGAVDREAVRKALASVAQFEGVTGTMMFQPGSGDPIKSAVILQIKGGKFSWVENGKP